MKNGYGTKTWVGGNKYEGEWAWDKRHGKGTFWVMEQGKLRKQYAGGWTDNKRDGMGVFYFADGGKYEGEWKANRRNGKGRMAYPNGEVYEGYWLEGGRSGMGTLQLPNGDVYEGQWLLDKKEGPAGRFLYMSTRKMYQGEWVDGFPQCGEYLDMPEDLVNMSVPDGSFPLPPLTLKHSGSVLNYSIGDIRNRRAAVHSQPGKVFNSEEMVSYNNV
ncbi:unnamed protein product [Discosporangium mesarthrocarpum]